MVWPSTTSAAEEPLEEFSEQSLESKLLNCACLSCHWKKLTSPFFFVLTERKKKNKQHRYIIHYSCQRKREAVMEKASKQTVKGKFPMFGPSKYTCEVHSTTFFPKYKF